VNVSFDEGCEGCEGCEGRYGMVCGDSLLVHGVAQYRWHALLRPDKEIEALISCFVDSLYEFYSYTHSIVESGSGKEEPINDDNDDRKAEEWGRKAKRPRKKGVDDVGMVERRTDSTVQYEDRKRTEQVYGISVVSCPTSGR
jgi:hypothetical protein